MVMADFPSPAGVGVDRAVTKISFPTVFFSTSRIYQSSLPCIHTIQDQCQPNQFSSQRPQSVGVQC